MSETDGPKSYSIEYNGHPVWFDVYGRGPRPVLLIPGGIGTGRTDFYEQLEGDDALDFDKFTIVVVEAPGWGRSRPPIRKYGKDIFDSDAQCFHEIMQHIGFNKYSIIGWSDGAVVALLMAIKFRDQIEALVLTALSTHVSEQCRKVFIAFQDVDRWDNEKIEAYLRSYKSVDEIQTLWSGFTKFALYHNQYFPTSIFSGRYHLVKCPVLIFHGDRDKMIDVSQPTSVCKSLRNAKLYRIASAGHDLHQRFPLRFKALAEEHILANTNIN